MSKQDLINFQEIIHTGKQPKQLPNHQETEIKNLKEKGLTYRQIQEQTGYTLYSIYTTLKN